MMEEEETFDASGAGQIDTDHGGAMAPINFLVPCFAEGILGIEDEGIGIAEEGDMGLDAIGV